MLIGIQCGENFIDRLLIRSGRNLHRGCAHQSHHLLRAKIIYFLTRDQFLSKVAAARCQSPVQGLHVYVGFSLGRSGTPKQSTFGCHWRAGLSILAPWASNVTRLAQWASKANAAQHGADKACAPQGCKGLKDGMAVAPKATRLKKAR